MPFSSHSDFRAHISLISPIPIPLTLPLCLIPSFRTFMLSVKVGFKGPGLGLGLRKSGMVKWSSYQASQMEVYRLITKQVNLIYIYIYTPYTS